MSVECLNPSSDRAQSILAAFLRAELSLSEIATAHGTTLAELILWLATSPVQAFLESADNINALRTRLAAGAALPKVVRALESILTDFNNDRLAPPREAPASVTDKIPLHVRRLRAAETARRAGATIVRLARFVPGPARPRRETGASVNDSLIRAHPVSEAQPQPAPHVEPMPAPQPSPLSGMGGAGVPPVHPAQETSNEQATLRARLQFRSTPVTCDTS